MEERAPMESVILREEDDAPCSHGESLDGEREALLRAVRTAAHARDSFLAIASHELRTPLTTLQLQVQGLLHGIAAGGGAPIDPARIAPRLALIERQCRRLERLVGDLVDVTRIASVGLDIALCELDFVAAVAALVDRRREEAARAGSVLSLHVDDELWGRSDPKLVEHAVDNLLANAIKYGSGKPIVVSVEASRDAVHISVRDQGIGIALEDQTRIFERFERSVSAENYGGLGLGLWTVQQIVDALGGAVHVASSPGIGSTFTIELAGAIDEPPDDRSSGEREVSERRGPHSLR